MSVDLRNDHEAPGAHVVHFYQHDAEIAEAVARYIADGIDSGELVIAVTSQARSDALRDSLTAVGVDIDVARRQEQLIMLDATATLSEFYADGHIDREVFLSVMGQFMRQATKTKKRLRIYGEMVALLWDAGDVLGAIELESLWNELAQSWHFSLYCSYHADAVGQPECSDALHAVRHLHTAVVQPLADEVSDQRHSVSQVFPSDVHSLKEVRQTVADALRQWDVEGDLIHDVVLVASELSANAILHAGSEVSLTVGVAGTLVRLEIRDASPAGSDGLRARPERGLGLVTSLYALGRRGA